MANSNGWGDGAANNSIGWGQGANNNIGWGDSHAKSWSGATDIVGIDSASSAYFTATGITGATQQTAIDNLVKGLKADGLWSKMKAVYPFVTDNRNLFGYTEDFSNAAWIKTGATVTANNILAPDGTMTADRVVFGAANNFIYQQTSFTATTANKSIYIKGTAGETISLDDTWVLSPSNLITLTGDWQRVNFTSTTTSGQGQGLAISTYQSATARTIWIWGAQLELGSTATTYQPIATTQQAFISSQFKYNLVNPVDSDAAFRLVFNGGWTHSSNGATPNGTNGYADTKLNPTTALTNYNAHASTYNRTNGNDGWEIGLTKSIGGYGNEFLLTGRIGSQSISGLYDYNNTNADIKVSSLSAVGFFQNSITSNVSHKLYKNGAQIGVNTNTNTTTPANGNIYLSAVNDIDTTAIAFSSKQCAFSSIGDGLTDTEAANLYTRVQAFQTALNRQV